MAFIEPMHRNKPNITYLLTLYTVGNELTVFLAKKNEVIEMHTIHVIAHHTKGTQKSLFHLP